MSDLMTEEAPPPLIRQHSQMRSCIRYDEEIASEPILTRHARIRASRGAFKFLPVRFSNDIVHGSWWMVWGSLFSTIVPLVPLIDDYVHFFVVPGNTDLTIFDRSVTWFLCILSGIFFTIGSWAFVRAFEQPPKAPLFANLYHISTDELFGAWMFLIAMIPTVPYSAVFLSYYPHKMMYWGSCISTVIFIVGSIMFVYTCYPANHHMLEHETRILLPVTKKVFGRNSSLIKHVQTDWLASTWFVFWSTFLWALGSYVMLMQAENDRQIFIWTTSFVDAMLFLVGAAYFCAGSYPPPELLISVNSSYKSVELPDVENRAINDQLQSHRKFENVSEPTYSPLMIQA